MKYQLVSGEEFNEFDEIFETSNIVFTDEIAPKGVELTDLSNNGDGSVVGWMEDNGVYKVEQTDKGKRNQRKEALICLIRQPMNHWTTGSHRKH